MNLLNSLGKKNITLVDRGNSAIKLALKYAKSKGHEVVYIPDSGGWITYKQFPKKFGLKVVEIKTDFGLIDVNSLNGKKGVLLYSSLAGYSAEQDIKKIRENFDGLIILDICNLGDKCDFLGDILLGSFGKDKVVNLGYGGFIATDFDIDINGNEFDKEYEEDLLEELSKTKKRLKFLYHKSRKIKEDLNRFDIIHQNKKGINVIVRFNNLEEKQKIIEYCDEKNYEYTECPRYIRVNEKAISIEVKRLK